MILLAVFLVFPAIYTIFLSFFRGRANSQFAEFVGITNYVNLLTADPNFINFATFPPSGAIWNNVLWLVFYTGHHPVPGPAHRGDGNPGPVREGDQGDRLHPAGDRGDRARRDLDVRLLAEPGPGPPECLPRRLRDRSDLLARRHGVRQRRADLRRHLGRGRVRDRHPVGGDQVDLARRSSRRPAPTAPTRSRSSTRSSCRWSACRCRSWR